MVRKIAKWFLITILVLAVLGVAYIIHLKRSTYPNYNSNVILSGLHEQVIVKKDRWGMPHIYAKNLEDLYRTLGYIMAQDRLWQMDLIRRATQGRLSEIFGKDFIQTDLLLRSLRITEHSNHLYSNLPDTIKTYLIAFSNGINQFIKNTKHLPIEFKILKYKPQIWTPENTLNLIGYMAWDLTSGWNGDIVLWQVMQKVDSLRFSLAVPNFNKSNFIYDYTLLQSQNLTLNIEKVIEQINSLGIRAFTASNNWAVGPEKSIYGKPILANDMHLSFGIPGIWYQVHLIVPGKVNVTGVTIPGAPGIVSGHNQHIAWGMTNVMLDNADYYIETINKDTTKYLVDGQWKPLKTVNEQIITKEGDTVYCKLYFTHRGPIVSGFKNIKDKVLSIAWGGNDTLSNELLGVFSLNFANNWEDFNKAVKYFRAVAQNIVYADDKGNFGIHMGAGIPIKLRPGYLPYPGDTSLYDWKEWVPYEQLPYEFNPKRGFVASANNKSINNYPYYITQYYFQDYRYSRIREMLENKEKLSIEDFKLMHIDQKSKLVEHTLPKIIFEISKIQTNDPTVKSAIQVLTQWDGVLRADQAAPLIYEEFLYQFLNLLINDELGDELSKKFMKIKTLANNMFENAILDHFNPWIDNINTPEKEDYTTIVQNAFLYAIDTIKEKLGNNIEKWQYGKIHTLTLEHPLAKVKILDLAFGLNRGPFAVGGSNHTVSPYTYSLNNRYKVNSGASQRHIFVVGDWDKGWMIIPTGNSGLPGNEFYCNQTNDFLKGIYRPDAFSDSAVEAVKKYERYFLPKN